MYWFQLEYCSMKVKEFLQTTPVFTTNDVQKVASSKESAETLLRRAVASGEISRVRRGLYASKTGKFFGEATEPLRVIRALDADAVVSYHTALVVHGLAHSVSFEYSFRTDAVKSAFSFEDVRYVPYAQDASVRSQVNNGTAYGSVLVTTREQTFVDCLSRPARAGGTEEVIRSLTTVPYVNFAELENLLDDASDTLLARCGWLLEQKRDDWHVDEALLSNLESRLGRGPYRFGNSERKSGGWSNRWRLCFPDAIGKVESWIWH